jgi:hypothetical protein
MAIYNEKGHHMVGGTGLKWSTRARITAFGHCSLKKMDITMGKISSYELW